MTVTYAEEVATAKGLTLIKLLFCKWRGSVFKLLWRDLLSFFFVYYVVQCIYRFALNKSQQQVFETFVAYAKVYHEQTPLSFLLGSFVSNVFELWWKQWNFIPWPTTLAINVTSSLHGFDEVGRAMRRTIMRYACLSATMSFRVMSPRVKKRFPELRDLIHAGLINEDEVNVLEDLDAKFPGYGKYWLPICWAANLATKAREDGRIKNDFALKTIIEILNNFRKNCGDLEACSFVYIPLVYTQTIIVAIYTYFVTALFAEQNIILEDREQKEVSLGIVEYVPLLLFLKFIFFIGWLKVAETMMNPFGEDDDDFDLNSYIDSNLQMSYIIVDEIHAYHPELLKDQFWDEIPKELPDRGRGKLDSKPKEKTDIFNTEHPTKRNVAFVDDASRETLKPRPNIIDESYAHLDHIQVTQSSIKREIEKNRRTNRSHSSDSDDGV